MRDSLENSKPIQVWIWNEIEEDVEGFKRNFSFLFFFRTRRKQRKNINASSLTRHTCALIEISWGFINRRFLTHSRQQIRSTCNAFRRLLDRDVCSMLYARPSRRSSNERALRSINEWVIICLSRLSSRDLTLSWILALSTGHWHRLQICCTAGRHRKVAVLLLERRFGRCLRLEIQFLYIILFRIVISFRCRVMMFTALLHRPWESRRWYFVLEEERKLQNINFNERCKT